MDGVVTSRVLTVTCAPGQRGRVGVNPPRIRSTVVAVAITAQPVEKLATDPGERPAEPVAARVCAVSVPPKALDGHPNAPLRVTPGLFQQAVQLFEGIYHRSAGRDLTLPYPGGVSPRGGRAGRRRPPRGRHPSPRRPRPARSRRRRRPPAGAPRGDGPDAGRAP